MSSRPNSAYCGYYGTEILSALVFTRRDVAALVWTFSRDY